MRVNSESPRVPNIKNSAQNPANKSFIVILYHILVALGSFLWYNCIMIEDMVLAAFLASLVWFCLAAQV